MDDYYRKNLVASLGGASAVLRRGARGDDVAELQAFLAGRGYDVGLVDGNFGRQTERALKQFQMESGIQQDGRAGKETYAAMERAKMPAPIPEMRDDYTAPEAAGTPLEGYEPGPVPEASGMPTAGYEPERFNDEDFTEAKPDLAKRFAEGEIAGDTLGAGIDWLQSANTGAPQELYAAKRRMNVPPEWQPQPGDGMDPLREALLKSIMARQPYPMAHR